MKRIRQFQPIYIGATEFEECVIEVPVGAHVTGAEDVSVDTPTHGWQPVRR